MYSSPLAISRPVGVTEWGLHFSKVCGVANVTAVMFLMLLDEPGLGYSNRMQGLALLSHFYSCRASNCRNFATISSAFTHSLVDRVELVGAAGQRYLIYIACN